MPVIICGEGYFVKETEKGTPIGRFAKMPKKRLATGLSNPKAILCDIS